MSSRMDRLRDLVREAPGLSPAELADIYMTRHPDGDGSYSTIRRQARLAQDEIGASDFDDLQRRVNQLEAAVEETITEQIKENLRLEWSEDHQGSQGTLKRTQLEVRLIWNGEQIGRMVGSEIVQ